MISVKDDHFSFVQITLPLVEIFSAIQGEGANVGCRQIFIRLAGCDLRCTYCDSAHTWFVPAHALIETRAGDRSFQRIPNPVSAAQILKAVEQLNTPPIHDSISLTGGEPLLHAATLAQWLPLLKANTSLPLYLETGGHHPEALQLILPYLDSVGMDIKLPSVSGECHWSAHDAFLRLCDRAPVEVFCKVIIAQTTDPADLERLGTLVASVNPHIPVFLQPVTPVGTGRYTSPPTADQVLKWQAQLKTQLTQVRVIPQTHKFLGQR
ncbi:7-carboxy-7-deazaguanine synthase QueE [Thermosynechococcus sp. HN-54]|uniref:7-carboxy-7-deazaguanine synthase QueE n=1 Tax=Thermosynechococcus sp. HN-54 TaxID=2933959 RepID=UPI00202D079E|nr:7-carboxy-7-deazaguanine synthase QueE [Thermosynechococcus sp. HN-54]URR35110.1 7-carboxy-7-deazaguanine synthase QueE [Thermosynechococcus sp. HN-54]